MTFIYKRWPFLTIRHRKITSCHISVWIFQRVNLRLWLAPLEAANLRLRVWLPAFGMYRTGALRLEEQTSAKFPCRSWQIPSALLHRIISCLTALSKRISALGIRRPVTKKYSLPLKPPAVTSLFWIWNTDMTQWPVMLETACPGARNSEFLLHEWS